MGTRADFYIGNGKHAEWLGSVGWDGYEWAEEPECALMKATTPDEFRAAIVGISGKRDDFTPPARGWPWPWTNSGTTDMAYMLIDGSVRVYCFGQRQVVNAEGETERDENDLADFPDMSDRQNVTFGKGSGLIVLGG